MNDCEDKKVAQLLGIIGYVERVVEEMDMKKKMCDIGLMNVMKQGLQTFWYQNIIFWNIYYSIDIMQFPVFINRR